MKIKKILNISPRDLVPIFFWFLALIVLVSLLFLIPWFSDFFAKDCGANKLGDYERFYYYLSLIFTGLIIAVALFQLNALNKTIKSARSNLKAEFLLDIDNRWGNAESLKARSIIHGFYVNSEKEFGKTTNENRTLIIDAVAHKILNLRFSSEGNDPEDFICLKNYLDLMETIGYLYFKRHVTKEDLYELCGHSLKFNYEVFRLYIKDKRSRHVNDNFYSLFAKLYDDINA